MALTTCLFTCHEMIKPGPVDELKHMQQPINSSSCHEYGVALHAQSFKAYAFDLCTVLLMLG